ncbi:MAG: helix-turn-helix transcriptional regulator [Actinobacteria bacterium]|nr:helix-turn-helix transcriptional regulator [Actinomycetota bacterium]
MVPSDRNRPLYMISVAAELAGVHPQTLRIYEAKGIIKPKRSAGNTRMYSQADIEHLELVSQLTDEGINLAGVMRILDLKTQIDKRDEEVEKLRRQNSALADKLHELEIRNSITALVRVESSANIKRLGN